MNRIDPEMSRLLVGFTLSLAMAAVYVAILISG